MMADVTACVIASGGCTVVVVDVVVSVCRVLDCASLLLLLSAYVLGDVALSDCNGVVTHDLTHCAEEGRVARSLVARGERVQQGGSVGGCTLVSRGWGQRETLRSHESRAEDCRAPQARCRPNLIRVRPGPNDCYLCATTIVCVSLYAQCAVHSRHRQSSSDYASSSTRLRRPQCGGRRQIGGTSLAPSTEHSQGLSLYCLSGDLAGDLVTSRHDCCMGA